MAVNHLPCRAWALLDTLFKNYFTLKSRSINYFTYLCSTIKAHPAMRNKDMKQGY